MNHHGRRFCWEVAHLFHLILVVIELLRTQERLDFININIPNILPSGDPFYQKKWQETGDMCVTNSNQQVSAMNISPGGRS